MRLWGGIIGVVCSTSAVAAPCPGDNAGVLAATRGAQSAVVSGDVIRFEHDVALLNESIACLDEVVLPSVAAQAHATLGLWHWSHREDELALGSMRAARLTWPAGSLSDLTFPEGDVLRRAFEEAATASNSTESRVPAGRKLWFDGVETRLRPADRPSLVQVGGWDGAPVLARMILPSDRLPSPPWVHTTRKGLVIGGATSLAAAVALFAGAWAVHGEFQQTSPDDVARLIRQQGAANGLSAGAIVASILAVSATLPAAALR